MIFKSASRDLSVKDVDVPKGIVTGYFSTYNVLDTDKEVVMPSAFTKSVAEQGPLGKNSIKHLRQHDRDQPVGNIQKLDASDPKGLYFESLMSKSTLGQDTLMLYSEGIFNQHSFAASVIPSQAKFDKESGVTYFHELKLKEGSVVTWGANAETPVIAIKEQFDWIERVESFLHRGTISDESFIELEEMYLRIKSLVEAHLEAKKAESQPPATGTEASPIIAPEVSDILSFFKSKIN